jgi:RNA polymerase sigma-70 factor (sigma-E family)
MSRLSQEQRDAHFTAFVAAHSPRLLHLARLLVTDRHAAEDLLQDVLARAYPRWSRIEQDDPVGYVKRALANAATDRWRRAWRREVPSEVLPEVPTADSTAGLSSRLALVEALRELSRRERAVICLRYYEDLTEVQTADWLELPVGTVKSLHHRALRKLQVSEELAVDRAPIPAAAAARERD